MLQKKKEWRLPQVIVLNNGSVQDGNPTASYPGEFYAICGGTCISTGAIYSSTTSGVNNTQIFCATGPGTIAVCS